MQWVLQICGTQIHCLGSGVWLLSWLHIPRLHTETWVCDKVPPVGPASRYMLCGTFLYNGGWCLLNSTGFEKKNDCGKSLSNLFLTMFFHKIERHLPKFDKFEFRYHSKFFQKKTTPTFPPSRRWSSSNQFDLGELGAPKPWPPWDSLNIFAEFCFFKPETPNSSKQTLMTASAESCRALLLAFHINLGSKNHSKQQQQMDTIDLHPGPWKGMQ